MRLKKLLALMLVGCLSFSMVACGGSENKDKDSNITDDSDKSTEDESSEDESSENQSSEQESSSKTDTETDVKEPLTEEDMAVAAKNFIEALMTGNIDTAKTYFPYNMTDEDWTSATSSLSGFESMNGKLMNVSDGVTAKMYFELKFEASEAMKMNDEEVSQLKDAIKNSEMSDIANYKADDVVSTYNVAVTMGMNMWVDDWTFDSAVVNLTDDQIEQLKSLTKQSLDEQSKQYVMGFAVCVADINGESKVILFESISEE